MNRSTLEEIRERVHRSAESHLDTTWLLTQLDHELAISETAGQRTLPPLKDLCYACGRHATLVEYVFTDTPIIFERFVRVRLCFPDGRVVIDAMLPMPFPSAVDGITLEGSPFDPDKI